jgi:hypothetical protein
MNVRFGGWLLLLFGVALIGCSKAGEEQFIPAEATARQALETALNAWKEGQAKPGSLSLGTTKIEVLDAVWKSGPKLSAYKIVGEESANGPRWFTVKLTLATGEKTVKYAVLGKDPIWVYSETDYKKLSGM